MASALKFLKDIRKNIVFNSAFQNNKIREFSEDINENLRNIIYAVLPAIIYIKYERPMTPPGNCMERAYLLSESVPNSIVVKGKITDTGEHFWVESGSTCYDPTSLLEYDKDVYYLVNAVKNPQIISRSELDQTGFIQYCRRRKISDFNSDPTYFNDLDSILPFLINGVKYRAMPEYKKEIDDYLERLGYYQKKDELLRDKLFRNL